MALGGVRPADRRRSARRSSSTRSAATSCRAANGGGLPSRIAPARTSSDRSDRVGNTFYAIVLVRALHRVLAAHHLHLDPAADARDLRHVVRRGAAEGRHPDQRGTAAPWCRGHPLRARRRSSFIWAVNARGFFEVLAYATLVQLIAMGLVGLSAVVAPKLRSPQLYRASASQRTVAGVPVVMIAGVGAVLSAVFVWWAYLHYDQLGGTRRWASCSRGRSAPGARVRALFRRRTRSGRARASTSSSGLPGDPTRVAQRCCAIGAAALRAPNRPPSRRTAWISCRNGAAMGIGRAVAERLVADAIHVAALDLNVERARRHTRGARRAVRAGRRRRRRVGRARACGGR